MTESTKRDEAAVSRRTFNSLMLALLVPSSTAASADHSALTFCCSGDNDVYQGLRIAGMKYFRYPTPSEAVRRARPGSGVLVLADQYPDRTVQMSEELIARAVKKDLRLYVEYSSPPGRGKPLVARWERAVVSGDFFDPTLPPLRILSLHNCTFVPLTKSHARSRTHMRMARVAGYDRAVFGLPSEGSYPLLVEDDGGRILTAATQLSRFVKGRYAPVSGWTAVWQAILKWLLGGNSKTQARWTPAVAPSWNPSVVLPRDAELRAFTRGVQWYRNARLFVHPVWQHRLAESSKYPDHVAPPPSQELPVGDGSLGMLEGHDARILPDGSQNMRWWIRADCVGETAMVLSLAQKIGGRKDHESVAKNLIDFLMLRSKMTSGPRMDEKSASYGLIGWNETPKYHEDLDGYDVYYGDDIARCLLGVLATMALTGERRWEERFWLALLGNFRLTGKMGHQRSRHDQKPLMEKGWRHFYEADTVLHDMNYQAYPWALFLWAFTKTGYRPFYERIEKGIRLTMEAYPSRWRWTNSITSQQARLLLPLAWLVRVEDTAEHRSWLDRLTADLLSRQHQSGAILEWTGSRETGLQMPPASNEEYGTGEGTLIQNNGDPATDFLYTMNFAFIGLHEAYAATNDARFKKAEDKIADLLVRAQATSRTLPQFEGAWFRAFDVEKWDYWASNTDFGWGAWCTESGWSQSWISSVFGLRRLNRSLWDVVSAQPRFAGFDRMRDRMLPSS